MTNIPEVPLSDMAEGDYPLMVRRDGEWIQIGTATITKEEGKPTLLTGSVDNPELAEFLGVRTLTNLSIGDPDLYLTGNKTA